MSDEGMGIEKEATFVASFRYLKIRIPTLSALPIVSLDRMTRGSTLSVISQLPGAARPRTGVV
ncbi:MULTISPECIES: hypothetical protein [unclassified Chelatococcus]|uniref:hypothetical protein n=1 Tax=unclassified Chelatococcus TaxID=2638111 RepID=UPI001BCB7DDD|nr:MULTISPECIES: hypothetical protein [unclassified Chelatococcus]MBS7700393.1 hypothetical protein [Chelatococcus sp. YT9]MBX3556189.1 hypothetical protein [Chelatococcus sp.]